MDLCAFDASIYNLSQDDSKVWISGQIPAGETGLKAKVGRYVRRLRSERSWATPLASLISLLLM